MQKLTDVEIIKQIFSKFNLIRTIEIRENEKREISYSLNYELNDGSFIVISMVFNGKPLIINAFHVKRNYQKFEQSLRKNYYNGFVD